ncbi:hypothetical protein AAFF_G00402630 [Aldrovandia affinis]|uniref:Uncharacterized protein n=1 Tax=Aldrovandia affinis TaxID=143900 RepID=A0AAD7WZQ0_9TELE|nr:hypothetical protein AAFF_G00402630 [Aldrovandia affinis]
MKGFPLSQPVSVSRVALDYVPPSPSRRTLFLHHHGYHAYLTVALRYRCSLNWRTEVRHDTKVQRNHGAPPPTPDPTSEADEPRAAEICGEGRGGRAFDKLDLMQEPDPYPSNPGRTLCLAGGLRRLQTSRQRAEPGHPRALAPLRPGFASELPWSPPAGDALARTDNTRRSHAQKLTMLNLC